VRDERCDLRSARHVPRLGLLRQLQDPLFGPETKRLCRQRHGHTDRSTTARLRRRLSLRCIVGSSDWQRTALNRVAALRRLRGGTVRVGRSDYYRCCDGRRRRIRGDPLFKLEGRVERAWRKKF